MAIYFGGLYVTAKSANLNLHKILIILYSIQSMITEIYPEPTGSCRLPNHPLVSLGESIWAQPSMAVGKNGNIDAERFNVRNKIVRLKITESIYKRTNVRVLIFIKQFLL